MNRYCADAYVRNVKYGPLTYPMSMDTEQPSSSSTTSNPNECDTLLGAQLAPRVRNVRYVAVYLVDTALDTAGTALARRWGSGAYGAGGVHSLVSRGAANTGWLALDDAMFYRAQRLAHAGFHDGPLDLSAHAGARLTRAGTVMAWVAKAPHRSAGAAAAEAAGGGEGGAAGAL